MVTVLAQKPRISMVIFQFCETIKKRFIFGANDDLDGNELSALIYVAVNRIWSLIWQKDARAVLVLVSRADERGWTGLSSTDSYKPTNTKAPIKSQNKLIGIRSGVSSINLATSGL